MQINKQLYLGNTISCLLSAYLPDFRPLSELREQCQLEQNAKRHLEEELRSDMEEKEHIIKALQVY